MINTCYYCGIYADTKDHIIPISWNRTSGRKRKENQRENLIYACKECNCLASDKVFESKEKKKDYLQEKLELRYKKILKMPDWSDDELQELSVKLRKDTMIKILAKQWIINRIAYPNIIYPEEPIRAQMKKIQKLF